MGVRVPMLVVSPFSAGGWVCSDTFDHTSQLQFIAERFGVSIPNVSAWRRETAGNLTTTLPTLTAPKIAVSRLPATSNAQHSGVVNAECNGAQIAELNIPVPAYPIPATQSQPTQGPNNLRPTPS
jgi:phospholipase C